MTTQKPDVILFLSDARGVYIPRDFVQSIKRECLSGVSAEDIATLESGPDHEWYWEAWANVCDNAIVTDDKGIKYRIYQDGDCWLIPDGMEWNEQNEFYAWPKTRYVMTIEFACYADSLVEAEDHFTNFREAIGATLTHNDISENRVDDVTRESSDEESQS